MNVVAEALSGRPFIVTAEVLAMRWGLRDHGQGLACGMCDRVPKVGDTIVFVLGKGAPNTFVCWDCGGSFTGAERSAGWSLRWREHIVPVLKRWPGYFTERS